MENKYYSNSQPQKCKQSGLTLSPFCVITQCTDNQKIFRPELHSDGNAKNWESKQTTTENHNK